MINVTTFLFYCAHAKFHSNTPLSIFVNSAIFPIARPSSVVSFYEKSTAIITLMGRQRRNWRKHIKQILETYEDPLLQASHEEKYCVIGYWKKINKKEKHSTISHKIFETNCSFHVK